MFNPFSYINPFIPVADAYNWYQDNLQHQQTQPYDAPIPVGPFNVKPFDVGEPLPRGENSLMTGKEGVFVQPEDPYGYAIMSQGGDLDHKFDVMPAPPPVFSMYSHPVVMGGEYPADNPTQHVDYGMTIGPWDWRMGSYDKELPAPKWTPPNEPFLEYNDNSLPYTGDVLGASESNQAVNPFEVPSDLSQQIQQAGTQASQSPTNPPTGLAEHPAVYGNIVDPGVV